MLPSLLVTFAAWPPCRCCNRCCGRMCEAAAGAAKARAVRCGSAFGGGTLCSALFSSIASPSFSDAAHDAGAGVHSSVRLCCSSTGGWWVRAAMRGCNVHLVHWCCMAAVAAAVAAAAAATATSVAASGSASLPGSAHFAMLFCLGRGQVGGGWDRWGGAYGGCCCSRQHP
jgi:hypothetical protein